MIVIARCIVCEQRLCYDSRQRQSGSEKGRILAIQVRPTNAKLMMRKEM
jgi:hypothetical protein